MTAPRSMILGVAGSRLAALLIGLAGAADLFWAGPLLGGVITYLLERRRGVTRPWMLAVCVALSVLVVLYLLLVLAAISAIVAGDA